MTLAAVRATDDGVWLDDAILVVEMRGLVALRDLTEMRRRLLAVRGIPHGIVLRCDRALLLLNDEGASLAGRPRIEDSQLCPMAYVMPPHVHAGLRQVAQDAAAIGLVRGVFAEYEPAMAWLKETAQMHRLLGL